MPLLEKSLHYGQTSIESIGCWLQQERPPPLNYVLGNIHEVAHQESWQ